MCGKHQRYQRRQQSGVVAAALLTAFREYQSRKSLPTSTSREDSNLSTSFQEPMINGVAYKAPEYSETINPHPPTYDEVTGSELSGGYPTIAQEKLQMFRLSTDERMPPHASVTTYEHNPAAVPRFAPDPAPLVTSSTGHSSIDSRSCQLYLLEAINIYFDIQIKLNEGNPNKVRHLESKKARKLQKAERKFAEHVARGKDARYDAKIEKRVEKMEKWIEWAIQRWIDHNAYTNGQGRRAGCHEPAHRGVGHMEKNYQPTV